MTSTEMLDQRAREVSKQVYTVAAATNHDARMRALGVLDAMMVGLRVCALEVSAEEIGLPDAR